MKFNLDLAIIGLILFPFLGLFDFVYNFFDWIFYDIFVYGALQINNPTTLIIMVSVLILMIFGFIFLGIIIPSLIELVKKRKAE